MNKTISIVVPTYNEEKNILPCYEEVVSVMEHALARYDFDIIFIDNDSTDGTRALIEQLCRRDTRVKAIFNARNFGQMRSHYYGLCQADGDCAVLLHADLQNPPQVIPRFVAEWESGKKVVMGIKEASRENPFKFMLRSVYYKLMRRLSSVEQVEHFSDFELLDREFLDVLRQLNDPIPYLRGIVSELGFKVARVYYTQNKRERGSTTANLATLYDFGMIGITSYSKGIMRTATVLGGVFSVGSLIIALVTLVQKLLDWDRFPAGTAAIAVGMFMLGSLMLFFIGMLGEYVVNINTRVMGRPLVIEERRLNFASDAAAEDKKRLKILEGKASQRKE